MSFDPRNLPRHPLPLGIEASGPLPRFRVFHKPLPIVGNPTRVQLVVENSVSAAPVAVDGGRVPLTPSRARDRLAIESSSDLPGRHSISVLVEDAPDDCRL